MLERVARVQLIGVGLEPLHKAKPGTAITMECLRNGCPHVTAVQRHGMALLFDLLREPEKALDDDGHHYDVWKLRQAAVAAGLHEVLLQAMEDHHSHDQAMDIWMMSQELLVGTNYQGEIPTLMSKR